MEYDFDTIAQDLIGQLKSMDCMTGISNYLAEEAVKAAMRYYPYGSDFQVLPYAKGYAIGRVEVAYSTIGIITTEEAAEMLQMSVKNFLIFVATNDAWQYSTSKILEKRNHLNCKCSQVCTK